ncbi:MAG: hypothetical protein FJX60_12290 [Alphaproteobacteria bacterium]|nr:hypothetical protein [Alphaproteobacteria bacterium]
MFSFLFNKKKDEAGQLPPGKIAAAIKSSKAKIDSTVYHLFQWDGFGFILKPYTGELIATQTFYPKITIELDNDSITIGAVPDNSVMELSWDGYDGADWGSRSRIA